MPEPPHPTGRIGKREFRIDLAAGTVTCPAGQQVSIPERAQASGERVVRFGTALCRPCPLRARCAPPGFRTLRLARREDLLQAGLEALKDPPTREHLRRTRPLIERLLGLLVHRYHARTSRYRGKRKACLQAAWTAVLVNLHPMRPPSPDQRHETDHRSPSWPLKRVHVQDDPGSFQPQSRRSPPELVRARSMSGSGGNTS